MRQDMTWSCRGGGRLAVLPRAVWLQLESHEHPYYPWLQTGSMLMQGFVGAACFPLQAQMSANGYCKGLGLFC